jgi:hypothetical protein
MVMPDSLMNAKAIDRLFAHFYAALTCWGDLAVNGQVINATLPIGWLNTVKTLTGDEKVA